MMKKFCRYLCLRMAVIVVIFTTIVLWRWSSQFQWTNGMQSSRRISDRIKAVLSDKKQGIKFKHTKDRDNKSSQMSLTHPCKEPAKTVVLIKTHKTGSTTLAHIVNSFGYARNLSFLLPKDVRYGRSINWEVDPLDPGPKGFLPPLHPSESVHQPSYNIFTLHTTYNHHMMESVMAPGSKYVTSIRDPVRQFESAFVFYKFYLALPETFQDETVDMDTKIEEWLRYPQYYRDRYKQVVDQGLVKTPNAELFCHNSQMRDLGLNMDHQDSNKATLEYISVLDRQFDAVVITEYFDESLLVLRKELCWGTDDILYISQNERPEVMKTATLPEHLRRSIRAWNAADQLLFEHFNKSLWQKIADYGDGFRSDLETFRERLRRMFQSCIEGKEDKLEFARVKYTKRKTAPKVCKLLASTKNQLMEKIRERQALTDSIA